TTATICSPRQHETLHQPERATPPRCEYVCLRVLLILRGRRAPRGRRVGPEKRNDLVYLFRLQGVLEAGHERRSVLHLVPDERLAAGLHDLPAEGWSGLSRVAGVAVGASLGDDPPSFQLRLGQRQGRHEYARVVVDTLDGGRGRGRLPVGPLRLGSDGYADRDSG